MKLKEWADQVAELLTVGDVVVVADTRDLALPGAIVYPATITPDRLAGDSWTVTWDLVVVVQDAGTPAALEDLAAAAGVIETAAHAHAGLSGWTAVTVTLPNLSTTPLPALRATLTTECED